MSVDRGGIVLGTGTIIGAAVGGGAAIQLDFGVGFVLLTTFVSGLFGGSLLVLVATQSPFRQSNT